MAPWCCLGVVWRHECIYCYILVKTFFETASSPGSAFARDIHGLEQLQSRLLLSCIRHPEYISRHSSAWAEYNDCTCTVVS